MNKFHIEETDIIIPKRPKTPLKRPGTALQSPHQLKGLFTAANIDHQLQTFDVVQPAADQGDTMLRTKNPCLFAIKTKATKLKSERKKTVTARPKTALNPSAAQMMPSLLTNHRLTALREPNPGESTIQSYQKQIDNEKLSIGFPEDPLAYFSKRKDGRGHRFLYLIHKGDKNDPNFNPYDLIKVPFAEVTPEYFTMSASGVTHIHPDGNTENFSLDRWAKESSHFMTLKKLRLFKFYFQWKPFRIWKNFVMRQRYNQISERVMKFSIINNFVFYQTALSFLKETPDHLIKKYLLALQTQKKYTLEEYKKAEDQNRELLDTSFLEYLNKIVDSLVQLDIDIRDPARLVVQDSDFPEIKRRNPNLGQLKVLERKKYTESLRRNDVVHKEINAFCEFIRLADTLIIESLSSSCYDCWMIAQENVSSDMASIFEIEVSFNNEGKVIFTPTLEKLISVTRNSLEDSLEHLNSLPRLLMAGKLRQRLRENVPNLVQIFDTGPSFSNYISCNTDIQEIENHIIEIISSSYHDAEIISQVFTDFFQIYQTGLTWDPPSYLKERGGDSVLIELFAIDDGCPYLSFDSSKEIIVDINKIRSDINRFQKDEEKIVQFRACTVRGALYIDSRQLRATLSPIPSKCLADLHSLLKDLTQKKSDKISSIIKACGRKFKREPTTLEFYVNFCDFIDRTQKLTPFLAQEITFVDELYGVFQMFQNDQMDPHEESSHPLHSNFATFKFDIQAAIGIKNLNSDKYLFVLQQELRKQDRKLQKYHEIVTAYPTSIQRTDVENLLPATKRIKQKIIDLEPKINELLRCEQILNIQLKDFSTYILIKKEADLMENIYTAISQWKLIEKSITSVPLISIDMPQFKSDLLKLESSVNEMKESTTVPNPLINELIVKLSGITPYIVPLEQLSSGRMQLHHWNKLFEECGQPNAYYGQIKIEELLNLGILKEFEKIAAITSTSQGESQLETNFNALLVHWKDVFLPLLDSQAKTEDSLILGPLIHIFKDIADSQVTLYTMLQVSYVQGIRDQVLKLSSDLESMAQILSQWEIFQSNWIVIAPVFSNEEIKTLLPQQTTKFMMVRRRWVTLIKHTLENITLFKVCSFPTLLDMLTENNKTLETILLSLVKYIDSKRAIMPRLYFLSNDEVLELISTNDFNIFNNHINKIFMNIRGFDSRSNETDSDQKINMAASQDFSRLKVYGIMTELGETLAFDNFVQCYGPFEQWVPKIFDEVHRSLRSNLAASLAKYQSGNMSDWVMAYNTFICVLTLQITFARDIDECFHNIENNSRAFTNYENVIQQRIRDMCSSMSAPLAQNELSKLSTVVSLLNYYVQQTRSLSEKIALYSQAINWSNHLRLAFNLQNSSIHVHFGDNTVEHGYEFFGNALQFIHTPASERVLINLCGALASNRYPALFGSNGVGKKQMLTYIAANYGRFIYFASSFQDYSFSIITRLFTGAASSGTWLCFANIHNQTHQNLSFIYELMRNILTVQNAGGSRYNYNSKLIEIKKSCRFFITADSKFFTKTDVPPQLKSILKPVVFAAPDIRLIIEIKLISLGFKSTKHLSVKISSLLSAITENFDYLHCKEQMKLTSHILELSLDFLRQLMHSKGATFVNYYEVARTAEEFAVARAFYFELMPKIKANHSESFFSFLYSAFKIFDNIDLFKQHLIHPGCFADEQIATLIRKEVQRSTENEYFIEQSVNLFNLLANYPFVIICGETNSGKTYVTKLLFDALDYLSRNADITNRYSGINKTKVIDLYHNIETSEGIFGTSVEDPNFGCVQLAGQVNSYLTYLTKFETTHHCYLRFNGTMTESFVSYLNEILPGGGKNKFRLSSLDTYNAFNELHILIETDSLNNIPPSIFSLCGILVMRNQGFPDVSQLPEAIVSCFNEDSLKTIKKIYLNDVMPQIAERIIVTPNVIFNKKRNKNLKGGKEIITEVFAKKSLELALCHIAFSNTDVNDLILLRTTLLVSFFQIYSSTIQEKADLDNFERWIRTTFSLSLPDEWTGFNVPDHFFDIYPRPSLQSTRLFKGTFIPVDFTLLKEKKPFMKKTDRLVSTKLVSDLSIPTAPFLPLLHEVRVLSRFHQNIFIYGSQKSGKSHFLNLFFSQNNEIIPIHIPIGPESTSTSITKFISMHSSVAKKKYFMLPDTKTFALIFDNVDPSNPKVIEFIRMIASSGTIPKTSPNDPKYLEIIELRNFYIIVTGEKIQDFPARFLTLFSPIYIPSPDSSTRKHIFMEKSKFFGIPEEYAEKAFTFIDSTAPKYFDIYQPLQVLCFLEERSLKNDKSLCVMTYSLLNEIDFGYLHNQIRDAKDSIKFNKLYSSLFASNPETQAYELFNERKEIIESKITFSNDMKDFEVKVATNDDYDQMKNNLSENLDSLNAKSNKKVKIFFSKPIIQQFLFLIRAICYPGGSCFLIGEPGSGRKSMTRFVAYYKEFEFVDLENKFNNKIESKNDFMKDMKDAIYLCITTGNQYVIFMRADDRNIEETKLFINLMVNHDFTPFFTEEELVDTYLKYNRLQSQTEDQNLSSFNNLRDIVINKIHLVLAVDERHLFQNQHKLTIHQKESLNVNKIDLSLYPSSYVVKLEVNKIEEFEEIARDYLLEMKNVLRLPEKLPQLLAKIHSHMKSEIPRISLNHFYDFLYEFNIELRLSKEDKIYKNKQIEIALKFLKQMKEENDSILYKIEEIQPEIDKLNSETSELEEKHNEKKSVLTKRSNELGEEEHLRTAAINKISDELSHFRAELVDAEGNVEVSLVKVNGLQEKDIKVLQLTAEQPSPKYKAFFELLCIFVENPPKYEPFGLALASDINIAKSLTNRIAYKNIPPEIIPNIKQSFAVNNFNKRDMEAIAPALGVLYDWIYSIYMYSSIKQKIQTHQTDLEEKSKSYKKYMGETEAERVSIQKLMGELDTEMNAINQSSAEKNALEKDFSEKQTKARNLSALLKNTQKLILRWGRDAEQFEDDQKLMIGNTVVFASYLVYGGILDPFKKTEFMQFISNEMSKRFITSTNDSFLYFVASQLEMQDEYVLDQSVNASHETTRDFHHIRTVRRTPLIIDPDLVLHSFICSQIKEDKLMKLSAIASSFQTKLVEAMQLGMSLVLTDVDELSEQLESTLLALLIAYHKDIFSASELLNVLDSAPKIKTATDIAIGDTTIKMHPDFKLYMFTSKRSINDIPIELLSRVTIVDASNSALSTTYESISSAFVNYFDPEMMPRLISVSSAETHYRVEMMRFEQETFNILTYIENKRNSDETYDFLKDDEIFGNLLKAKECFFAVMNVSIDFNTIKSEHTLTVEPFLKHIDFCGTIWEAASRYLPRVNKSFVLPFERYISFIKSAISSSGVKPGLIQIEGHNQLHNSLVNVLMKGILQSLTFEDSIFLMFTSAYLTGKKNNKYREEDFDAIVQHITDEINGKADMHHVEATGDPFEQLKFTNIVDTFHFIRMFISANFSSDYANFLPIFQIESFFSGNSATPVIIMTREGIDSTSLLEHFVTMRNRADSFEIYPLFDDDKCLQRVFTEVTSAVSHGIWAAVQYTTPSKKVAQCIADIYTYMISGNPITTNFRLVIIAYTAKYLPVDLMVASVRINIENYPSVRHQMLQVYQHHSTSIRSSTNPKLMKKISYIIILLYSIINFSSFINPLGLYEHNIISEITVKEAIDYLRSMIDAHVMAELPIRNIRDTIQETMFGNDCIDTFDRRKVRSLVFSLLTPEMLEENFSFVDQNSEESDRWTIPPDAPISNYSHVIEKLPVFTSCDVLLMSRGTSNPVRKWNLSRWIAKPFQKLAISAEFDENQANSQYENLKSLLPNKVDLSSVSSKDFKVNSPILSFIICEINNFNKAVDIIWTNFFDQSLEILKKIGSNKVPINWNESVGYFGTTNLKKFVALLKEKEEFFKKCLKEKGLPGIFDVRLIRNVRGLLFAFLHQVSFDKSVAADSMTYEFTFSDLVPPNSFSLGNIYLVAGNYDKMAKKFVKINSDTEPFTKMQPLNCQVVKRSSKVVRAFQCPLYLALPMKDFLLDSQKERIDGEVGNFVWYIPIMSDLTDKQCVTEGTSLVCHISDIFE